MSDVDSTSVKSEPDEKRVKKRPRTKQRQSHPVTHSILVQIDGEEDATHTLITFDGRKTLDGLIALILKEVLPHSSQTGQLQKLEPKNFFLCLSLPIAEDWYCLTPSSFQTWILDRDLAAVKLCWRLSSRVFEHGDLLKAGNALVKCSAKGETKLFEIDPSARLTDLFQLLAEWTECDPLETLRVTYGDTRLDPERTANDYHLPHAASLSARIVKPVMPGCGGPTIVVVFKTLTARTYVLETDPNVSVLHLRRAFAACSGMPENLLRFLFGGTQLEDEKTLDHYGIQNQSTVGVILRLCGGKPVIYLLPPAHVDKVQVQLKLVSEWHFSAYYPIEKIKDACKGQQIDWTVSASPGGKLVNKTDGQELSYLYWEAEAWAHASPAPHLPFDPSCVNLDPTNAALLPFDAIVPHLQNALKALSLNVDARTSFITYWLPALMELKNQHIAFRFVPQNEYEKAAPLEVTPQPDCVTRVFWVFKGIPNEQTSLDAWEAAKERARVVDWASVVGLREQAWDAGCFRVLEWGGMHVRV